MCRRSPAARRQIGDPRRDRDGFINAVNKHRAKISSVL
jgi:hypothetical protein